MDWQPIAIYDKLKKKPKRCVFFVAEKKADEYNRNFLSAMVRTEKYCGSRTITHWLKLPDDPPKEIS